jgi:hypothetical protein
MTNSQSIMNGLQVNSRSMLVGGSLIAAGGLMALAGLTISGSALFIAVRRWVNEMEEQPTDLARRKWAQAKKAGAAGAAAWQNGDSVRQGART